MENQDKRQLQKFLRQYKEEQEEMTSEIKVEFSEEEYKKLEAEAKEFNVPVEDFMYAKFMLAQQKLKEEAAELGITEVELFTRKRHAERYWYRLKQHPGIGPSWLLTLLFFIAAFNNRHLSMEAAFLVGAGCSAVIWCIVLISNFRR